MQGAGCSEYAAPSLPSLNWARPSAHFSIFSLVSTEVALCSLVCSAGRGREHSFSEHAQAQMGALDYPVECSLFADEETEAWGILMVGGSVVSCWLHSGLWSIF